MQLMLNRVDDFEKGEPVEIRVTGTDLPDSMFTHKNSRVRIVQQIAREMRKLRDHLLCDCCVSLGRDEDAETRRGDKCRDELPGFWPAPRPSHDLRVSRHPKKLIKDCPSRVPGVRPPSLTFEPVAAGSVEPRVAVGGVDQDIGVNDEHISSTAIFQTESASGIASPFFQTKQTRH